MLTVEMIRQWKTSDGWHVSPDGHHVRLGEDVRLGDGVTSEQLNQIFREAYAALAPTHRFVKWVTSERMSPNVPPNVDGGKPIKYEKGAIVEEPNAVVSDQQCGVGLHVLRPGYRPEWVGLCGFSDLIPLEVEVASEDIIFAGLPTMDIKLRVRRLKVLT